MKPDEALDVVEISPPEVIDKLEYLGIKITRRTLLNYEKWGLVPEPVRGSLGRGKGNFTHYPEGTVEKARDAYLTLNGNLTGEPSAYMVVAMLRAKFPDVYRQIKTKIQKDGGKANA